MLETGAAGMWMFGSQLRRDCSNYVYQNKVSLVKLHVVHSQCCCQTTAIDKPCARQPRAFFVIFEFAATLPESESRIVAISVWVTDASVCGNGNACVGPK